MKKNNKYSLFVQANGAILSVILTFLLITGMTSFLSARMSSDPVGKVLQSTDLNSLFLYFFGMENKNFTSQTKNSEEISFSKVGLQIAANIKINDIKTFFERELPGFSEFNTNIQVAGKGTSISTLPIESSPPSNSMLNQKGSSAGSSDQNNAPPAPAQTTQGKKVVYIYHTHSWESFLPLLPNAQTPDEAVSSNNTVNIVGVGDMLAQDLEEKGIGVDHNTVDATAKLHERGWDYNNAYQFSREGVQTAMATDKDLTFMFDIHRDSQRKQLTTATINNKNYARLDFIVGEANPDYQKNLEFAKELHALCEKKYPGLSRGIFSKSNNFGNGNYNQDLSPKAMLIEVGGIDNNSEELKNAMQAFADVFSQYYWEKKNAKAF